MRVVQYTHTCGLYWLCAVLMISDVTHTRGGVSDIPCPQRCQCVHGELNTVTVCNAANLTSIPTADISNTTRELILNDNHIPVLEPDSFMGLHLLRTLIIRRCNIHTIEANAFRSLSELRELDLKWNHVREIESYSFSNLPKLRVLTLDYNDIHHIYSFAFHGLKLARLSLEVNPSLQTITPDAFQGAEIAGLFIYNSALDAFSVASIMPLKDSLKHLSITHNQVSLHLPETLFKGFKLLVLRLNHNQLQSLAFLRHVSVEDLSLSGNGLSQVNFSNYLNLHTIRVLHLEHNNIQDLAPSALSNMNRLEELHLAHNNLTLLHADMRAVFSRLHVLTLEGNPLHCNCRVRWLRVWLESFQGKVYGARCVTPTSAVVGDVPPSGFICSPPHLVTITRDVHIALDHQVSLSCIASGDPTPSIYWRTPQGDLILTAPPSPYNAHGTNIGTLTIRTVSTHDAGSYHCVASNIAGNTSAKATIDVYQLLPGKLSTATDVDSAGSARRVYDDIALVRLVCVMCTLYIHLKTNT